MEYKTVLRILVLCSVVVVIMTAPTGNNGSSNGGNDGNNGNGNSCTIVQCVSPPCDGITCPGQTTCVANYCNGCNFQCVNQR